MKLSLEMAVSHISSCMEEANGTMKTIGREMQRQKSDLLPSKSLRSTCNFAFPGVWLHETIQFPVSELILVGFNYVKPNHPD